VLLTGLYTHQRQDQAAGQNASGPTDILYYRGLPDANADTTGRPGIGYPGGPTTPFVIHRDTNGVDNLDQAAAILNIQYRTNLGFDITSVGGFLRYGALQIADFDGTDLNFFTSNIQYHRTQVSEELRLQSNDEASPLQWQGGVFFFTTDWNARQVNSIGPSFFSQTNATSPVFNQFLANKTGSTTFATFGQADYEVLPGLILTAGARYSWEWKRITSWPVLPSLEPPFGIGMSNKHQWGSLTVHFGARYQVTDDVMVYGTYSTGQKSGGFSTIATTLAQLDPYAPEKAKAWEFGLRSEWWDHRFRLNLTGFWNKYSDLQVGAFRPVSGGTGQQSFIANSAFERARGIELQAVLLPVDGLLLSTSIGYDDARYSSFVAALS
jgi:iron complex outermembrane receptor protein